MVGQDIRTSFLLRPYQIPDDLNLQEMYDISHGRARVRGNFFPPLLTTWKNSLTPGGGDPMWDTAQCYQSKKSKIFKIVKEQDKWVQNDPLKSVSGGLKSMNDFFATICSSRGGRAGSRPSVVGTTKTYDALVAGKGGCRC